MSSSAIRNSLSLGGGEFLPTAGGLLLGFLLLNPVADYVSVFETRLILGWMHRQEQPALVAALAVIDLILTTAIVVVVYLVLWAALLGIGHERVLDAILDGALLRGADALLGVYVYTTFVTSIWIWLYVLAEFAFRLFPGFQRTFPIQERPFQSVGFVVSVFSIGVFLVVGILARLADSL